MIIVVLALALGGVWYFIMNDPDPGPNEDTGAVGEDITEVIEDSPEDNQDESDIEEGDTPEEGLSLESKTWKWIQTAYNNDTQLTPNDPEAFTITFMKDGEFSATTDCNSMSGAYALDESKITFGENIAMTRMFCEGSQEQEFAALLGKIQSYFFTENSELIFDLKFDSGSATFQ